MGCFSAPKTKAVSTMDPLLQQQVMNPLTQQMGESLFGAAGTPAVYKSTGCFGTGPKQLVSPATEGTQGAFTGAPADWAYQGQRVAGTTPLQQGAFDWAGQLPGQMSALMNQAPNFDATRQYTAELWNRDIAPGIMERFAGMGGAASGGAQKALQRAGETVSLGMASQLAPMELQARQGAAQLGLQGLGAMGTMGAEQRNIAQQGLTGQQQQFYESSPWNHPAMQYLFPTANASQRQLTQESGGMGYSALTGMAPALGMGLTGGIGGWLNPAAGSTFGAGWTSALGGMK